MDYRKILSHTETERALERADAKHHALPSTKARQSPYTSIFDSDTSANSDTSGPTSSRISLGKFNATTATYSWPILPKTPPPLPYYAKQETNKSTLYARGISVSSKESLSPPRSITSPTTSISSYPEESRFDRHLLTEPFKSAIRIKQEDGDPENPIIPSRPAAFDNRLDLPGSRPGSDSPPARQIMLAIPEESPHWSDYAKETKTARGEGGSVWTCRWTTTLNGISTTCTYTGKKQLVKRHIETTHLKKKPYICEFCNEKFPQRTSLRVHISSRHTRDYPWKCPDCTSKYNDPARLHRHRMDTHDYVPKATSRNIGRPPKNSDSKPPRARNTLEIIPYTCE